MNFERFIAKRIVNSSERSFSKLIVGIAITGITIGLAVMIISFAIISGFKNEIQEKITGFAGSVQITAYDLNSSYESTPINRNQDFLKTISNNNKIKKIEPFAYKAGIISSSGDIEGIVLKGVDQNFDWDFFADKLLEGSLPTYTDSINSNQVLISSYTANRLSLKNGDSFTMFFVQDPIRKRKFTISGIYSIGMEDLDKIFVMADIRQIQKLNDWLPTEVGGFEIVANSGFELNDVAQLVSLEVGPELNSLSVAERYPQLFEWLDLLDVNADVILVLMLLVASINMISALLIMILERTNMIGILKALGAGNRSIRKVFIYNAIYLIGYGMLLGNIIGIGFCYLQSQFHFFKLDQESYYLSSVPIDMNIQTILLLNAGTLITSLLMLIIPSSLVSSISPLKAIRFK